MNRLILHAGPKRTATTYIQRALLSLSEESECIDRSAHEGNSHNLCLILSKYENIQNQSLAEEFAGLNGDIVKNTEAELLRLNERIRSNRDVILLSELFSLLTPISILNAFGEIEDSRKFIIFTYRKTEDLLRSLFSNCVVGGYRGHILDFIGDVGGGNICSADLFPDISSWEDDGWQVIINKYDSNEMEGFFCKTLGFILDICITPKDLSNIPFDAQHTNRSLTPEKLLYLSIFNNALHEHPINMLSEHGKHKFGNQILMPFLRDTPFNARDFDANHQADWYNFVNYCDTKRKDIFRRYFDEKNP